jgi:2-iminobutanoate/2-iminopropanoate deaminase
LFRLAQTIYCLIGKVCTDVSCLPKQTVFTPNAPKPVGPYSQAVISDGMVFVSGQIPINPKTGKLVEPDVETQTVQVLENIKHILESVNVGLDGVLKTTVFLSNLADFAVFNKVYGRYFADNPPARTTVQAGLLAGVLVEIDVIAKTC